jgi:integrase
MKGARTITREEIRIILANAGIVEKGLLLIGTFLGTRISETLALTFGDFSGQTIRIEAKKGGNANELPIAPEVKAYINELKKHYTEEKGMTVSDDDPLFISRKGEKKSIGRVQASKKLKSLVAMLLHAT